MRIQKPFWILFIISGVSLAGAIVTQADLFYRLFYTLALIIFICFLWAFFSNRGYQFKRYSRGYSRQQGDFFEENYEIENKSIIIPAWIIIEDLSTLPHSAGNRMITWKAGDRIRRYLASTYLMERGSFQLGPTELRCGDPFGLFIFSKKIDFLNTLKVYPTILPLSHFMGGNGMESWGAISRIKGSDNSPPQVSGIREYVPGDPLSHIHWASTAKKEKWMVREFEIDPKPQVWIFLDSCAHFRIKSEKEEEEKLNEKQIGLIGKKDYKLPCDTFEYSVCIAASISQYYLKRKVSVGLITNGNRSYILPAENGEKQFNKILDALALIQANGTVPISGVVEGYLSTISKQSTIILITPSCENEIFQVARLLVRKRYHPVVCLLDPYSFGGTDHLERIKSQIQGIGVPILPIFCNENLMDALDK
jgi:uncharacterized protein (DUF58 family)